MEWNDVQQEHVFPHMQCRYYISEYYIGFRLVSPRKGETYEGKKFKFHSLVFMLEGETLFSYDNYLNRHFKKGDLFFTPQASTMYGVALEDSYMLVLTFSSHVESLCDLCSLTNYAKLRGPINYNFDALPITPTLWNFARLMEEYIHQEMRCSYLHQLKQKELFILLQYCYTEEQVLSLLYPALGLLNFKSWILENYNPDRSMSELAAMYNMTPKSFSRKFKSEFNMTFRKWIIEQKAKHIKLKLSMPKTTFNDIVREFNFADLHHFYRFCKEQYCCTAKNLVAQIRNQNT